MIEGPGIIATVSQFRRFLGRGYPAEGLFVQRLLATYLAVNVPTAS
jgi:hypothetical protein